MTTLRAREQDIRREKASSNVCTNQTLIAVAAMIQLSWLGTAGLRELALRCARGTRYAREALLAIPGVAPLVDAPVAPGVRPAPARSPADGRWSAWPRRDSSPASRSASTGGRGRPTVDGPTTGLLVAVTERRTQRRDRRLVSRLGEGGALMADDPSDAPRPGRRPAAGPPAPR